MTDVIDEIRKDIAKAKYHDIWDKYGVQAIILFSAIIILASSYLIFTQYQKAQILKTSFIFFDFQDKKDQRDFATNLEISEQIINNGSGGYVILAQLQKSKLLLDQGKIDDAINILNDVAKNKANDSAFRNLAKLNILYILIIHRNSTIEQKKVIDDMFTQLSSSNNPWYFSVMDAKLAWLINQDKYKEAYDLIGNVIIENNLPMSLDLKMQEIKALIARDYPNAISN